ncbi:MAG: hypothetical protein ACSLE0_17515, partial [Chitinophagaceae bacterium]
SRFVSVSEITEHMVWAETGGINGMWKAMEGIRNNQPIWSGEAIHKGLSIEQIIEKTWQPKEKVPEVAKPRWGGSVGFWIPALKNCHILLEAFSVSIKGMDTEEIIYPHIMSGPLNVNQRMEFLRFHLERHQGQIENVKAHPDYPQ